MGVVSMVSVFQDGQWLGVTGKPEQTRPMSQCPYKDEVAVMSWP